MFSIRITGTITVLDAKTKTQLVALLESIGVNNICFDFCKAFDEWCDELPSDEMIGLKYKCLDWIREWNNGGGDNSTTECIRMALDKTNNDRPREIAQCLYHSIHDYTKTAFEASALVQTMLLESIRILMEEEQKDALEHLTPCSHCSRIIDLSLCDTDQYWTNDGDRIVYHICSHCGESVEDICSDPNREIAPPFEEDEEVHHSMQHESPCSTNGDYSPGNPWDAPGMSIKDFI